MRVTFFIFYDLYPYYLLEPQSNRERQVNLVDTFTQTVARHTLKYGVNYRRLVVSEALPSQWEVGFYFDEARGYDAVQADMTLRRDFPFTERVGLQFRAEAYNIFNHPSFGSIYNSLANGPLFGQAYTTEDSQLGGLSTIYQVGGARSMQVALKLHF